MDQTLLAAIVPAIITVIAVFIGYLITYLNNLRLSQYTEQLNRVNKQLGELYGPLYSIVSTGNQVWSAYMMKYEYGRPNFARNPPPTHIPQFD